MKLQVPIPKELAHLKLDSRGYPIPYFVPIVDGVPNFRFLDRQKQLECVNKHICPICGKKLHKDYSYIVNGPLGMKNRCSTDPAMHRTCAEFSLMACPHLFYQKAERKEDVTNTHLVAEKPPLLVLIRCRTKFRWVDLVDRIFRFEYVSHEEYHYVNNVLQKATE